MYIMETWQSYIVLLKREIDKGKMFALQFSKGIKNKECTFLIILKLDEECKEWQAPKAIQEMLEEFKDVSPLSYLRNFLR